MLATVSSHFMKTSPNSKTFFYLFLLLIGIVLNGCYIVGAFLIAKNAIYKISINEKRVKGSDLTNGILFEELVIFHKDSSGIPIEYLITERFECYNPGFNGVQKYWPDKIYFNKKNGHYLWGLDTVNFHIKKNGRQRVVVYDSILEKTKNKFYYPTAISKKKYATCPIKFKKDTWYFVNIYDRRILEIYLYVDQKMNFHIYKYDSGVCPI